MKQREYKEIFDKIAPDPALVARACRAAEGAERPRRGARHVARRVVAAAAVLCLLAALGTSFALVETVDPSATVLERWDHAALAEPVGVSASSLGWTVTVEGVVSDHWYAYLLCTLSRDDGGVIEPGEYGFHGWDFGIPAEEGYGWSGGIQWLADGDLGDSEVPFLFHISNQNSWDLCGYRIRLTLEGLSTAGYAESWALMMAGGGRWALEFDLPARSRSEDFAPGLVFQLDGKQAVLETLRVTPLEVWAEFTSGEGAFAPFNAPQLVLTDGSTLRPGGGGGAGDGSLWYGAYAPREGTVTAADLAALRVGDTDYPLALE